MTFNTNQQKRRAASILPLWGSFFLGQTLLDFEMIARALSSLIISALAAKDRGHFRELVAKATLRRALQNKGSIANYSLECAKMVRLHHVEPGHSWGTLTASGMAKWKALDCDAGEIMLRKQALKEAGWKQAARENYAVVITGPCTPQHLELLNRFALPASLLKPGLKLFGSCENLVDVVQQVSSPQEITVTWVLSLALRRLGTDSTLKEIANEMKEDRYHLFDLFGKLPGTIDDGFTQPGVIVDAGANIGDFSISAWLLHPSTQVLCFEPSAETYFVALWNMVANNVPILTLNDIGVPGKVGVIALHGALTNDGEDIKFYHNPKRTQISAVAKKGAARPPGWTERIIPSYNLASTLTNANVLAVDLFKLDCEGCEFAILGGLYKWISSKNKVKRLEGEIHWHLSCPRQYNDPVAHVSKKAADDAERALHDRGCPMIREYRRMGQNWDGIGDVSKDVSC